jgi:hypothetical protein
VQGSFLRTLVDPYWEPIPLSFDKYVFARIKVTGESPPAPDEFQFVRRRNNETTRGTAHPEISPKQQIYEREPRYTPDDGIWSGWIAFIDEAAKAEEAYIEWEGNRWALPDSDRRELQKPHVEFDYGTVVVPDRISRGEPLEIRVELKNGNDHVAGICRGALHVLQPRPQPVTPAETARFMQVEIEPAQTATWSTTFEGAFTQSASQIRLLLKSHADFREYERGREFTVEVTR